jgi:hypothetical protein
MRFLKVWFVKAGNNVKVKCGSLGTGLHREGNAFAIEQHLNVDNVVLVPEEEWGSLKGEKKYLILDTRFRQIVTEDYLGEWDEVYEL